MDHDKTCHLRESGPVNASMRPGAILGFSAEASPHFDGWALPLISAWPKVLEIVDGRIPLPQVVEIFLTNHCNFRCPHCRFREVHGKRSEHMPIDSFRGLLVELGRNGVGALELSGGGEPLDHPEIERILDLVIDGGFRVGLITNGYPLIDSPGLADRLLRCADWIRVSVDAFSDRTYRKVHGNARASYRKLYRMLAELRQRRTTTPKIGIKVLVSRINARDSLQAVARATELGADYLQFKFLATPEALALSEGEAADLARRIDIQVRSRIDPHLSVEIVPPYRGPHSDDKCLMSFLHAVVDWNGEMYVCAFFEHRRRSHSFGNINDGGFFAHWHAPQHQATFDAVDPKTCVPNCPMRRYNPVIQFIRNENYRFSYI